MGDRQFYIHKISFAATKLPRHFLLLLLLFLAATNISSCKRTDLIMWRHGSLLQLISFSKHTKWTWEALLSRQSWFCCCKTGSRFCSFDRRGCKVYICGCIHRFAATDVHFTTDAGSPVVGPRNKSRFQNMCYCFSGLAFRNCGYNFGFLRETGVFCEIWIVLCWFRCEMFDSELWFEEEEKKRLVV